MGSASATVRVRVPFVDVDSSARIHYTAWMRYMEVAEHALMRAIEFPYASTLRELAFPRVHLECDLRGAIRYDDELEVTASVAHVSARSWTVAFAGRNLTVAEAGGDETGTMGGLVVAEGKMTIVAMNPETERSCALPEPLRLALLGQ